MNRFMSLFLSLTLINGAACVEVPGGDDPIGTSVAASERRGVEILVTSRVETPGGGMTVDYTIDGRRYRMEITGAGEEATQTVRQGQQTLLVMTARTDGSIDLADDRGHAVSLDELRDDPSLILLFDQDAVATLDANVLGLLTTGDPEPAAANPAVVCYTTWLGFAACAAFGIGAYIASCVDWEYKDGKWTVTGSC